MSILALNIHLNTYDKVISSYAETQFFKAIMGIFNTKDLQ